ncbi:MAG: TonB-dependent receptor [Pyrinomonadaceae bacterium]|nr:TonB-dependent receptor [Pyrinomonadaceae bacterium]
MRKTWWRSGVTLMLALLLCGTSETLASSPAATGEKKDGDGRDDRRSALGTITGLVMDSRGRPVAGAVVSLLRGGAGEIVKQVASNRDGSFSVRAEPGRYVLRAFAEGFNSIAFPAVQINASDNVNYRFNLEPAGQGRTVPEQHRDRNDPKYRVRSTHSRRSIFNHEAGENPLDAEEEARNAEAQETDFENASDEEAARDAQSLRLRGVVETFYRASASEFAPSYAGINFAVANPVNDNLDLILAGQTGTAGAPQRLEVTGRARINARHRLNLGLAGARVLTVRAQAAGGVEADDPLSQISVRAVDEWIVRDGVVVVLGLDYSRFIGGKGSINPRFGVQFDANARTRLRASFAPGADESRASVIDGVEDGSVMFAESSAQLVSANDGRARPERSRRLEFGVERILDERSSIDAALFFDTTDGRGVGLLSIPVESLSGETSDAFTKFTEQQGAARGLRVVYARRLNRHVKASAGYSLGRGQELAPDAFASDARPDKIFRGGYFQTAAAQLDANFDTGTTVQAVFRFSPRATVFAIDPFAGRLAVYDPSLSILITQELPTFGLPVRAEAVVDARNLLDRQTSTEDGETIIFINGARRSVRGGISVRF